MAPPGSTRASAPARAIVTRQGRDGEGGSIGAPAKIERGPEKSANELHFACDDGSLWPSISIAASIA